MIVKVTSKSENISSNAVDYAQDKIQKLSRYYDNITRVDILLDQGADNRYSCEVIASLPRKKVIVYQSDGLTTTSAIDLAIDGLARKVSNFKDKLRSGKQTQRATRRLLRKIRQSREIT